VALQRVQQYAPPKTRITDILVRGAVIEMIAKDDLLGKHVAYRDKDGKDRIHKVIKIVGKTLTVKDVLGDKTRIHPDKFKIYGRQLPKHLEEIDWT
jgi:hypothetical protein